MLTRRNLIVTALCGVLGALALVVAALSAFAISAATGFVALLALYGLLFSAALCFCGLILGDALEASPFSSRPQAADAAARRRTVPIAGSVVVLIVLWFVGGTVLKRILLSTPPGKFEAATAASGQILGDAVKSEQERLTRIVNVLAQASETEGDPGADAALPIRALALGAGAAWTLTPEGRVRWGVGLLGFIPKGTSYTVDTEPLAPDLIETLPSALEVWKVDDKYFVGVGASIPNGRLVVARRVPRESIEQWKQVESAAGVAAQRDVLLARQAAHLNTLLYVLVLLLLSGVVVFARDRKTESDPPPDEAAEG